MAKRPASINADATATAHIDALPPAMDYSMHEATYEGFVNMVKWGIISLGFVVLALYAFIEGHNVFLGWLLVLAAVLAPLAKVFTGSRRS